MKYLLRLGVTDRAEDETADRTAPFGYSLGDRQKSQMAETAILVWLT